MQSAKTDFSIESCSRAISKLVKYTYTINGPSFAYERGLTYGPQRQHNNGHVEYSNTSQPQRIMGNKNTTHPPTLTDVAKFRSSNCESLGLRSKLLHKTRLLLAEEAGGL